jgi:glyoxylase-like metal-dependent hydrolase (beta-lactamase superfamily II)
MIQKLENSVYQLSYEVPVKGVPVVNGYLILGDRPVLIDGGASDDATYFGFKEDIKTLGLTPQDLGAVLVTHNHLDHIGLASRLAKEIAVQVHVHEDEWYMVAASEEKREEFRQRLMETFLFWGVPEEVVNSLHGKILAALRFGGGIPLEKIQPYPRGVFSVGGVGLDAIHCPGHTDGLVCLWWPDERGIFSNDHVLEAISPNPTIYMQPRNGRDTGLADYLESLGLIEDLPVDRVYPGHGHPFSGLKSRVGEIRGFAAKRRSRILFLLREAPEGMTILEVTHRIWEKLDGLNTFLGCREVHGFMEILMGEGLVTLQRRGKVGSFRGAREKLGLRSTLEETAAMPPRSPFKDPIGEIL